MPVKIVTMPPTTIQCGVCGNPLPAENVIRAFVFDKMDEISAPIRSGDVNLAVCPVCNFHGWFWPGMIVADRHRGRAVFISIQEENKQHQLDVAYNIIAQDLFEDLDRVKNNTLWVESYHHVYEPLCGDDHWFALQVQSQKLEWARVSITDPNDRARRWINDSFEMKTAIITQREGTQEFLDALRREVLGRLGIQDLPSEDRRFLQDLTKRLEHIGPRSRRSPLPGNGPVSNSEVTNNTELPIITVPPLNEDLRSALRGLIESSRERMEASSTGIDPIIANATKKMLTGILGPHQSDIDELSAGTTVLLENAIAVAPEVKVESDLAELTFGEVVRRSVMEVHVSPSRNNDCSELASIVEWSVTNEYHGVDRFVPALFLVLVNVARHTANPVCSYLGLYLARHLLERASDPSICAGIKAAAVLTLVPDTDLRVPSTVITTLAILWQDLGRFFKDIGESD